MNEEKHQYYKGVPLVRKLTAEVENKRGHHIYADDMFTGRLRGSLHALTPLHVGTGLFVPPADVGLESDIPLLKSFHTVDSRLTIPGSSLKGAVRSLVEMLTYACVNKRKGRWRLKRDKEDYGECRYNSKRREGELCTVCKMFGAMGYEGQIYCHDAAQVSGSMEAHFIPPQYQPKGDDERRYYPHHMQDEREGTWPLQVATAGSQFDIHIAFNNLSAGELGLLLLAVGQGDPPICLKLGAGKSSGLGAVRFVDLAAEVVDVQTLYTSYDSQPAWKPLDVARYVEEGHRLLRTDRVLDRLQQDLGCGSYE